MSRKRRYLRETKYAPDTREWVGPAKHKHPKHRITERKLAREIAKREAR